MTVILDYLSGKSYKFFVLYGQFLKLYLVPLLVIFLPDFSFFLTLCVGVCALDKADTYFSLHRAALYRKRHPSSILASSSGGLYELFPS